MSNAGQWAHRFLGACENSELLMVTPARSTRRVVALRAAMALNRVQAGSTWELRLPRDLEKAETHGAALTSGGHDIACWMGPGRRPLQFPHPEE